MVEEFSTLTIDTSCYKTRLPGRARTRVVDQMIVCLNTLSNNFCYARQD